MSRVHSALTRSIPTCAAVLVAASLAGCVSREEAARINAAEQVPEVFTDPQTGCQYLIFSEGSYGENTVARSAPDGSHMGCRATTPAEADAVGTSEASAPLQSPETPEGREERS